MAEGNSKTPYNSIYETLTPKNPKAEAEVVCCKHGCLCPYGRKPVENQYVNLPSPSNEQQVAEKLAAKLEKLKVKESKIGGSKEKRKKEKRQQPEAVVEDNHAYEMMGPPTEGSTASSALVTTESLENNFKTDNTASSSYIGVQCTADAETHVTRRGEFAIYHLSEPGACINNLTSSLPLMLVYYTTTKKHRHYPIRSSGTASEPQFSVDCGYPIVRKHFSLNQLVQYYKTFGSIQIHPDDTCADSFSWWLE